MLKLCEYTHDKTRFSAGSLVYRAVFEIWVGGKDESVLLSCIFVYRWLVRLCDGLTAC